MEFRNYGTCETTVLTENILLGNRKISRHFEGPKLMGMCRTSFLFSIYLIVYVMFLFSGAAVFSVLETPPERALRARLDGAVQKFLDDYPNVSDQALEDLISEVIKASNKGISVARNSSGELNWSFGQSLFFSSTVVTTIGYGHVTPLSRSGKIFCILYAMVGIPLTLVLLSALVERLLVPTIWLLQWLTSFLGHLYQPLNIRLLHLLIIEAVLRPKLTKILSLTPLNTQKSRSSAWKQVLILIGFFLVVPAAIFANLEPEWDYLDSLYYCFISLTTIGLGDYIPGDSPNQSYRPLYKIAITGYLFLGITFMMLTLTVFYDIPQLNLGLLFTSSDDMEKVRLTGAKLKLQYGTGTIYSPNEENSHR